MNYFEKYIKYKTKYEYLKRIIKGGTLFTNMNNNLYLLFITEKLIAYNDSEIEIIGGAKRYRNDNERRPTKLPKWLNDYELNLTEEIIRYASPFSQNRLLEDFKIDDELLMKLQRMQEIDDPDYVAYENYGKLVEAWIADNLECPCCNKKSLRRYFKDNMPVIDVVCINPEHTIIDGVKFFQIKSSNGSYFNKRPYFSYNINDVLETSNIIHVGSKNYGKYVHEIKPKDSILNKKILIGYICVQFSESDDGLKIIINLNNSFIILPSYLDMTKKRLFQDLEEYEVISEKDNWYYKYVDLDIKHNVIKFNLKTNNVKKLNLENKNIPKNYFIKNNSMINPLQNTINR